MRAKSSYRLLGGALALSFAALILWRLFFSARLQNPDGFDQARSTYSLQLTVKDRTPSEVKLLLGLKGLTSQKFTKKNEIISAWEAVESFDMIGGSSEALKADLLHKPILSVLDETKHSFQHFSEKTYPKEFIPIEANLRNKILLPLPLPTLVPGSMEWNERDELGSYRVRYTIKEAANGLEIDRTWLQYVEAGIKVDSVDNTLTYEVSRDGRLLSVHGRITLHQRLLESHHFTTELIVKLESSEEAKEAIEAKGFAPFPEHEALSLKTQKKPTESPGRNLGEVLKELAQVTQETDDQKIYGLFGEMKQALIEDPESRHILFEKIRSNPDRDPASKRRLEAIFGALAQSGIPIVADELALLARQCADEFCRMQAIVGLSDHPKPTEASIKNTLSIATESENAKVSGTAFLSAATMTRRLGIDMPALQSALTEGLAQSENEAKKRVLIAAMGNQGAPQYFESLKKYSLAAESPGLQAAAVYSMRFLPQKAADGVILKVLSQSRDKRVMTEAIKALDYRNLSHEQYQDFAKNAAELKDPDLAEEATNILSRAFEDDHNLLSSMELMRDKTVFPGIRSKIEQAIRTAKEWDP